VLGVAAAKLGWSPVVAVDHEPASVEAAGANALANGVALDVRCLDLRREPPPGAPTVAANLLRPLLLGLAETFVEVPRNLIAGGLLVEEADEVVAAFAVRGLAELQRRHDGDWAALLLARPAII
jgi:ribosomal protein L11 methyltransferase